MTLLPAFPFWRRSRTPSAPQAVPAAMRRLDCLEYEDRTLFSATPVGAEVLVQAASDSPMAPEVQSTSDADAAATAAPADGATAQAPATNNDQSVSANGNSAPAPQQINESIRTELVIVDGSVANYQQLIDDLRSNADDSRRFEVLVLDPSGDGIQQITAALTRYDRLSALHFVTHATDGALRLGETWLTDSNVADYAAQMAQWRTSLTADADLLFYGCELAATEQGRTLLTTIEQATGADVNASTDNTGNALFGGNWKLEYVSGGIETAVAFSETVQRQWMNLMNVAVDSASSGVGNNTTQVTIAHTTSGTNRLMLVSIAIDPHDETVSSVTYNGVSLTFIGSQQMPGNGDHSRVELWYMLAPTTGTHDVVVDITGTANNGMVVGVMTFTGVDQTTPYENFTTDWGMSTAASVTVSSQVNDLVFSVVHSHTGSDAAAGAGQTEYWDLVDEGSNGSGTVAAGAASVSNTWVVKNDDWTAAGVSIRSVVNTAPTLDATRTPVLGSVNEDAVAPSGAVGTLISSLVDFDSPSGQVDNVTDADASALLGIAVTAADTTNGSWWYTTDGGSNWNALGSVSNSSARLLAADANTRLYFQPNANYNGTVTNAVTFRAWDQTTGTNGSLDDASTNGGSTAFSSTTDTAAITVSAVNDAPVNTVPGSQSTNEDTTLIFSSSNGNQISIADVDAGSSSVQVTLTATNGTITLNGISGLSFTVGDGTADATMTFTGTITNINTALNGLGFAPTTDFNGAASLQIVTNDQGNAGSGGSQSDTDSVAITVNVVNDAPVNTVPGPQSTNEDTTLVFSGGNGNQISIADVDAGSSSVRVTLTATNGVLTLNGITGLSFTVGDGTADATMTFTGTITNINNALNGLGFAPTADFNGAASLQIVTNDLGNTGSPGAQSDTDSVAISVNPVNDAPVLDNTGTMTLTTITEDNTSPAGNTVASIIASAGGNRITDVDSGAAEGIAITSLTASNGAWEYSTDGGGSWLSVGTVAGNSALLLRDPDLVRFVPNGSNGSSNSITFRAWDQTSGSAGTKVDATTNGGTTAFSTAVESATITVTSVNDAPVLDNTGTMTLTTITEDDTNNSGDAVISIIASAGGDRITDVDSGAFEGFAVTGLVSGNGTWQYSTTGGVSWSAVGAVSDSSALLLRDTDRLRFVPDGQNSTAPSITFRAWDQTSGTAGTKVDASTNGGATAFSTASGTASITVNAVNDAPATTVPGPQSTNEDTALVFSSGNGNQISIADVDAGSGSVQVTLTAAAGTITLNGIAGLSFSSGDGAADGTMTFTGTVTNINNALNGLSFTPTADFNGAASLQIVIDDLGNTGSGGALSDTDSVAITVNAVNDAPVLTLPATQTTPFQTSLTFSTAQGNVLSVADADAGSAPIRLTLTAQFGTITLAQTTSLTFVSGTGSNDTTIVVDGTVSDLNAALDGLTFTPDVAFRGTANINVVVDDLGNSGGAPQSDSGQIDVTVDPATQRLLFSGPATQDATNFHVTFSSGNGNPLLFTDVYLENPVLTVTIDAASGTLTLSTTQGLSFISGSGSGASMSFTGTLADVNAALDGALFSTMQTNSSLTVSATDPPRDGTGPHSAGGTTAITQPAVFPGPSNSPTVDVIETNTEETNDQDAEANVAYAASAPAPAEQGDGLLTLRIRGNAASSTQAANLEAELVLNSDESALRREDLDLAHLAAAQDFEDRILQASISKFTAKQVNGADRSLQAEQIAWSSIMMSVNEPRGNSFTENLIVGTAGITASVSVGYVLWSLRAASLLSTMLTSMPAWQSFDPLPVIDMVASRKSDDSDEDDTQDFFEG